MKKFIFNSMLLGGLVMTSCSDNVLEKPVHEEYAKSFVELFGPVHPEQDWNMAQQKSVTVEMGTPGTVFVYAKTDIAYNLVGQYENVSGSQVLKFDAPETVNDFIVYANGEGKKAGNGERVAFDGVKSRGAFVDNLNAAVEKHAAQTTFPIKNADNGVASFLRLLTEGNSHENLPGLKYDFFALGGGANKPSVFPVYWNSGMDHELGIYFRTVENGQVKVVGDLIPIWRTKEMVREDFHIVTTQNQTVVDPQWEGANGYYPYQINTNIKEIVTRGFDLNLTQGAAFGFYLKVWHDWDNGDYDGNKIFTWYTDKELNDDQLAHAAYFEFGDNVKYLCFEDFRGTNYVHSGQTSDRDFNDVVFVFNPAPEIVHNEGAKWVLAVEDLGVTDDYDFNDAVLCIERVSGTTTAKVTPLAAGGTLPIQLMHDGNPVGEELHSYFGAEPTDGKYPMINTTSAGAPGESFEIPVTRDWSLAEYTKTQMGGFNIMVDNVPNETIITPPNPGEAPQMICVPYTWNWPKERVRIDTAYPGFTKWGNTNVDDTEYAGAIWGNGYLAGGWLTPCNSEKVIANPLAGAEEN